VWQLVIGPDFYQQQQLPLLTDEDRYRINVFDCGRSSQGYLRLAGSTRGGKPALTSASRS